MIYRSDLKLSVLLLLNISGITTFVSTAFLREMMMGYGRLDDYWSGKELDGFR